MVMKRRLVLLTIIMLLVGFGVGTSAAQNSYSLWFGTFWANEEMTGNPVATTSTGVIDYDWGSGSPAAGVPSNHWSAQWTAYVEFEPGTYRFHTENDDGVRVFLGSKHIITDWHEGAARTNEATVSLLGGTYSMAVDFFDVGGRALLRLGWQRLGPPRAGAGDVTIIPAQPAPPSPTLPQSNWLADYWNNTDLSGPPVLTRHEAAVDDDWGTGSPLPGTIDSDYFSARWSRAIYFAEGSYRFTSESDDGIRVSVGGNTIIDDWNVQPLSRNTADVDLAAGAYAVVVEYFEKTGDALARFNWERRAEDESSPTGLTATVYAGRLNMRDGPSTGYDIITKLPYGSVVPVVGRTVDSSWLQVTYQGATGWIWAAYTAVSGDLTSAPVTG
jgi:hypothetical protein